MLRLGDIHQDALGTERNVRLAVAWWRQAAALGHAEAQAMVGAAHLSGEGVPADSIEALHWLLRAEAGGAGEMAEGYLKEARAKASALDQAEAQRRATGPLPGAKKA
jgi:TPR repeat protein